MKNSETEYKPASLSPKLLNRVKELEFQLSDATGENIILIAYDDKGTAQQNPNSSS